MTTRETLTLPPNAVRFASDGASGVISGYAAVFDELVPGFNELLKRGAFTRTLREHQAAGTRPIMLWSHNPDEPIGIWTELVEDERGLKVTGKLIVDAAKGKEALALLSAGAINGLSIGFRARNAERGPNGARVLKDVQLEEISLVAFAAAPSARVTSVRHAAEPASVAAFIHAARRAARDIKARQK